jgi:hypothetical protein
MYMYYTILIIDVHVLFNIDDRCTCIIQY